MNDDRLIACYKLPEEFLKVFGLSFDDCASKIELVFEAGKLAIYNITFLDRPAETKDLSIKTLNSFADMIKAHSAEM